MRFVCDENFELPIASWLRAEGHDVWVVGADIPFATDDEAILSIAHRESRIIITYDHDFGELVVRHGLPHSGVIYLRLGDEPIRAKIERLAEVLDTYRDRLDRFLVVTMHRVREVK